MQEDETNSASRDHFVFTKTIQNDDDSIGVIEGPDLQDTRLLELRELGMPMNLERIRVVEKCDKYGQCFEGYKRSIFGVKLNQQPDLPDLLKVSHAKLPPDSFPAWGGILRLAGRDGSHMWVQVWIHRIFSPNTKAYIEDIWFPHEQAWVQQIAGIQFTPRGSRIAEIQRLAQALMLSTFDQQQSQAIWQTDFAEFQRDAFRAVELLARAPTGKGRQNIRRRRSSLTKEALADKIGMSKTKVYEWLDFAPWLWTELVMRYHNLRREEQFPPLNRP